MTASSPSTGGTITVGVDGSPSSERALRFAVDTARETAQVVHAVIAWDHPVSAGIPVNYGAAQMSAADWESNSRIVRDTGGNPAGLMVSGLPGTKDLRSEALLPTATAAETP